MSDIEAFQNLLATKHPCVSISTYEEDYALSVIREAAIAQSMELWLWSINGGLRDGLIQGGPTIADTEHSAAAMFRIGKGDMKGVFVMLDLAGSLKDDRTRRTLRDAIDAMARIGSTMVLIDCAEELPPVIASTATSFELSLPDEAECEELIRTTLRHVSEHQHIQANLLRKELNVMIRSLRGLTRRQIRQIVVDSVCDDQKLDASDLQRMLLEKRRFLGTGSLLECVEAPTELSEIGGLSRLKLWLARREESLSDEAIAYGLGPPRGILMLGVQGAGKSLAAKAVATAWKRPLLRMDVGALYDKYIGESERRLRDALKQADMMAPIILWIDEIEKGFASAASQSSDGGLSKRMFGTLLTWMQEHTAPVFLIATANDIEALPPELLRKGRFDEIFFVDLPTRDARKAIFQIHLTKRKRDPVKFDLDRLADASDGYSGAEIEAAVLSALNNAYADKTELTTQHVLFALKESPPLSVTMREKINELREWSVGRCVPAD